MNVIAPTSGCDTRKTSGRKHISLKRLEMILAGDGSERAEIGDGARNFNIAHSNRLPKSAPEFRCISALRAASPIVEISKNTS